MFHLCHSPPRSPRSLFGVLLIFVVCTVQTSAQCGKGQKKNAGDSNCVPCSIGKYQDSTDHDMTACPACPDGYHNAADASSAANHEECTPCPNGKYFHSIEDCKICGQGKRTLFNTNIVGTGTGELKQPCEDCPFGRYSADSGTDPAKHTICQQCEPGFYFYEATTSCKNCEAGKYQNNAATHDGPYCASQCPRNIGGRSCPERCRRECSRCSKGEYSEDPTTDCTECAAGMYQDQGLDASSVQECKICEFGKYANIPKMAKCTDCAAGFFLFAHDKADTNTNREAHDEQSDCVACYPGKSSGAGAQQCGECSSGQYSISSTGSECTKCEIGRYQVEQAKSSCELCPRGFFQTEMGKTFCLVCYSGQYQNDTEKTSCEKCSPGYYQSELNATLCIDCPVGFKQYKAAQALCNGCTPGLYQSESAQESCNGCTPGYYQHENEQIKCIVCPSGYYQKKPKQNTCVGCSAGMFAASNNHTKCEECPIGQRAGEEANECDMCKLGETTLDTGSRTCLACPIGRIGGTNGLCIGCRVWGIKQNEDGKQWNIDKLYQDSSGRTACKECKPTDFGVPRTALEIQETSEAGERMISTPGCVNPDYKLESDCSEYGEYLEDCDEYGSDCKVDLKPTSEGSKVIEMLAKRTCMQCEPGMICDEASKLSARNILRRTGWYYLDPTVLLLMGENPMETREIRKSDDHKYWDEKRPEHIVNQWRYRYGTNDAPSLKQNYDEATFTAVPCPIPSHCCGAREPTVIQGGEQKEGTVNYKMLDENINCQLQRLMDLETTKEGKEFLLETALKYGFKNYSQIYGTRIVNDERIDGTYIQIKYPFWNNSCAYGVDTDYPLCAKCAPGFEPTGFTEDCIKCQQGAMIIRASLFSLFVVLVGVSFILVKKNKKCQKHCSTHEFKKASGDIGRMIRLLIDFLQIVLSMPDLLPDIGWPAEFLKHLSMLNYVDLNVMDMLGIQCTYDVDYINQMYMYMSVPIAFICFALLDLMVNKKLLNYKMVAAKNSGQLNEMWDHTLGEMFEFLLEPNTEALIDPNAPAQVVCERSLVDLLKISNHGSRVWSDPAKEAHSMMTRFAHHEGYLTKFEFCEAFTQVMEDRASHNSKSNKFANESIKLQKFNLLSWSSWQKKRAAISERTCLILLLIHAPICKVVFNSFFCRPVADRRYLLADYGVNCGTSDSPDVRYNIAFGFAIATISLYVFGFPLAMAIYLVVKRKLLFTFRLKMMLGWIYLHYKPGMFWWTLWEVFLKIFLMGLLFFFNDDRRSYAGAIVSIFALATISFCGPFKSRIVLALAIVKWFAISMMFLSTTQMHGSEGKVDLELLMALMLIVYACFALGVVLIVYRLSVALRSAHAGNAVVKVRSAVHRLASLRNMAGSSGFFDTKDQKHLEHAMSQYDIKMKRLHSVGSAGNAIDSSVDNLSKQKQQNSLTAVLPVNGSGGKQEGGGKQQENQQKKKQKPENQQEKGRPELPEEKEQQAPQELQEQQEDYQQQQQEAQQQKVQQHPAPRNIGKGWWETYDPKHQNFYYTNVDGKPTSWNWPAEIPQEDFSAIAQQNIKDWGDGVKGSGVKRRSSGKLRKKMTVEQVRL